LKAKSTNMLRNWINYSNNWTK